MKLFQGFPEDRGVLVYVLHNLFTVVNIKVCQSDRAGDWVSGEGVAVREGGCPRLKGLKELFFEEQCAKWSARIGNRLCRNHHIRLNVVSLRGKHVSGASETCDGFVGDQDHVVLLANLPDPAEIARVCCEAASGVLDRLDKEGGHGVGTFEENCLLDSVRRPQAKLFSIFETGVCPVEVGVWNSES